MIFHFDQTAGALVGTHFILIIFRIAVRTVDQTLVICGSQGCHRIIYRLCQTLAGFGIGIVVAVCADTGTGVGVDRHICRQILIAGRCLGLNAVSIAGNDDIHAGLFQNGSRLLCQNAADRSFVGVAHIELVVLLIGRAQINGFRVICLCGSCGRLSRCGSHIVVLLVLVAGAAGTALHQQYDQQDQNQKNCQNPVIPDAAAFTLRCHKKIPPICRLVGSRSALTYPLTISMPCVLPHRP